MKRLGCDVYPPCLLIANISMGHAVIDELRNNFGHIKRGNCTSLVIRPGKLLFVGGCQRLVSATSLRAICKTLKRGTICYLDKLTGLLQNPAQAHKSCCGSC